MGNRIIINSLKVLTGAGMLAVSYAAGTGVIPFEMSTMTAAEAHAAEESVMPPVVEANLVETHTVEYVEETVIEKEYVDIIREVPVDLRNFISRTELEDWLESETRMSTIRFSNGKTVVDCDDYAFELQQEALEDGYIVSFAIIGIEEYNELFSSSLPASRSLHAINLAIVGNDVYYIEPQTCETVQVAYLD